MKCKQNELEMPQVNRLAGIQSILQEKMKYSGRPSACCSYSNWGHPGFHPGFLFWQTFSQL